MTTSEQDPTVHGVNAPLQDPAEQAAQLVAIAEHHGGSIHDALDAAREDADRADSRLWAVTGYMFPLTQGNYAQLVLAEMEALETRMAAARRLAELQDEITALTLASNASLIERADLVAVVIRMRDAARIERTELERQLAEGTR